MARGYPHHDPLFTLLFLAADFLPAIRLSPRGVWDVQGLPRSCCRHVRPRRVRTRSAGSPLAVLARGGAGLADRSFPFRATWWGGWILAVAEAGIVGGLADWFAVTAIFRRPLGLPIPHTALIPANWELMAAASGSMVGDRVLTREYVGQEIDALDVADAVARGAGRLTRPRSRRSPGRRRAGSSTSCRRRRRPRWSAGCGD